MGVRDTLRARLARTLGRAVMRPTAVSTYGPLSPLRLLGMRGGSLRGAVRGRITLVTGASSGIGAATARRIGRACGEVVLVARSTDKLEAVAADVRAAGGTAHVHPCDLSDLEQVEKLAADVLGDLGRVDILVNNAGRSIRRSLSLSYDRIHDFQRTIQLNYLGSVQLMLQLLPGMRERGEGHVVVVSTAGAQTRVPRFGAYIASKVALDALCDSWQAETADDGVHFTTVHMGLVRTPMIAATPVYRRFPSLSADDAAAVVCDAIVHRPRRVSPPFGMLAATVDAVAPLVMDRIRSAGYRALDD